ncbi:hypothetical protein D3C72_1435770 [compost metagenome]
MFLHQLRGELKIALDCQHVFFGIVDVSRHGQMPVKRLQVIALDRQFHACPVICRSEVIKPYRLLEPRQHIQFVADPCFCHQTFDRVRHEAIKALIQFVGTAASCCHNLLLQVRQ